MLHIGPMLKGYNSDLKVRGRTYHVQTEDWGSANPFLVSRIFQNGAVIKTVKIPYDEALRDQPVRSHEALRIALQKQHHDMIDALMDGRIA